MRLTNASEFAQTHSNAPKRGNRVLSTILFKATLALILTTSASAEDLTSLRGVGLFESATFTGRNGVSYAGGAELLITGSHFDETPSSNSVFFSTSALSTSTQRLAGPPLTQDDQFQSATVNGKLAYKAPSLSDLMNGLSLETLKAFPSVQGKLEVDTKVDENTLSCSGTNCNVNYRWDYTPIVYYVTPAVVFPGIETTIVTNPRNGPNTRREGQQAADFRIDGTSLDFSSKFYGGLTKNARNYWKGPVMHSNRNLHSEVSVHLPGTGYAYHNPHTSKTCNLDESDCYTARTVPSITSVSSNAGYTTGGLTITLEGTSLDGSAVVEVDGVSCVISEVTLTRIVCETAEKVLDPVQPSYVGQHGLRRTMFNETAGTNIDNYLTTPGGVQSIHTNSELVKATDQVNSFDALTGYFKAPVSGNYRFHQACDDACAVSLSLTDPLDPAVDPLDPAAKQEIMNRASHSSFRNFYKVDEEATIGSAFSEWIPLLQGEYYYYEQWLVQGGGEIHHSVGVEIEPTIPNLENHYHKKRPIQQLTAMPSNTFDTSEVRVSLADGGSYWIMMLNPKNLEWIRSAVIYSGEGANDFKNHIAPFYKKVYGATPVVERTTLALNGTETTVAEEIQEYVYRITLPRCITAPSTSQMLVVKNTTLSNIAVFVPEQIQLSSPPLSGAYVITCSNPDGTFTVTRDIAHHASSSTVSVILQEDCPFLRDAISVYNTPGNWEAGLFRDNGIDMHIHFWGVNQSIGQFTISPTLGNPLVGTSLVISQEIIVDYGPNYYYDVLPFDWLYTNEAAPQVKVTIDGQPAVCAGLDCDFVYSTAPSQITAFTVTGVNVVITGTVLPTATSVKLAHKDCTVVTNTATEITCTLSELPAGGNWFPKVRDEFGLVPVEATVLAFNVPMTFTGVTPSTWNSAGGEILTLTGTNFPSTIEDGNTISIVLGAAGTKCNVLTTTPTEITCITEALITAGTVRRNLQDVWAIDVTVNEEETAAIDGLVEMRPVIVESITPASASPILLETLVIQFNNAYPSASMDADTFTVNLIPRDADLTRPNGEDKRGLNVVEVSSADKTITVKYGGAYSGIYDLEVHSLANGNIDTSTVSFEAIAQYSSFSPTSGSIYGGTLLTITGNHFSKDDIQKNAVKVGYEYQSGIDHYCYLISTSDTEIKCRIATDLNRVPENQEVIVFLGTSEEAQCNADSCQYAFLDMATLPTLEGAAVEFDTVTNEYRIVFTGTQFTGDTTTVEVMVGGFAQTIVSVDATTVVAQLDDLASASSSVEIYFPEGLPEGFQNLFEGLTFDPALVGLNTNIGSPAGSRIEASVKGAGPSDNLTLVNAADNSNICVSSRVTSYGVLECETKVADFSATITLKVKDNTSGSFFVCANSDPTQCQYTTQVQGTDASEFTAVVKSDASTLSFTGVLFPIADFTCSVTYAGVASTTCTINSATDVSATFANGVPTSEADVSPKLTFESSLDTFAHHAIVTAAALTNAFAFTSTTNGLTCSFEGGCEFSVVADGLAAKVSEGSATINVCGKECTLLDSSDATTTVCAVPAIHSIQSNTLFNQKPAAPLLGANRISAGAGYLETAFDGNNVPGITGSTNGCYAGVEFGTGYVGVLESTKFFMDYFTRANLVDNLVLQGSNDAFSSEVVDILTVSEEIHEGWNMYDLSATAPTYSSYRYYNAASNCNKIGEIQFIGHEVLNSVLDAEDCATEVVLEDASVTALDNTVQYQTALTPTLTSVAPRFGSVVGGDAVTFTGTGFSVDPLEVTVTIDGQDCAVTASTATTVTCTTGARIGLFEDDPTLEIIIAGKGRVVNGDVVFRYASLWSSSTTWGGQFAPVDGESVVVPKGTNLLVDIDSTPKLNLVLVEGSLIFPSNPDPTHVRTFDAKNVFVHKGYMEVGTEADPYTSKLVITLEGNKRDPYIPTYGNKVIGVRYGTLDIHGVPRQPTWTHLETTVSPGDTTITLNTPVDWQVGEEIIIATTSFKSTETEQRTITAVAGTTANPVLTLDSALTYKHFAGVETYGAETIEMRAEVGLLTRNIKFRGDPETSGVNQYGAHIMIHSPGDESSIGRIEYMELHQVGQAFQLGRYPMHFHMIGTVNKSYIRGNAVHQSFNRGTTLHGVHYLRIQKNVVYSAMGHNIFIEDAIETNNLIEDNLVANTLASHSLLNTDSTPASFWITHPDNIFRRNAAAGSARYGFWFDLQTTSIGPSFDPNVCPTKAKLGEFTDNVTHSNGRYGLRIFHGHSPRTRPCSGLSYNKEADILGGEDPYASNPPILAEYKNFLGYKNNRNGVIGGNMGHVHFVNIKTADNKLAGIEIEKVVDVVDGYSKVDGALIIGASLGNRELESMPGTSRGIITPRSDNWQVHNVNFYNFDFNSAAALGSCSHCFHSAATDPDARTITFSGLSLDAATVPRAIRWQFPDKGIFLDLDGTLTGIGANTWATSYLPHNLQPECTLDLDVFDGITCNDQVQIRRVVFQGYQPGSLEQTPLNVLQWDDETLATLDTPELLLAYEADNEFLTISPWRMKPFSHWAVPFVTGHNYQVRWAHGLDFTKMTLRTISSAQQETDLPIELMIKHFDVREAVWVDTNLERVDNETLTTKDPLTLQTGDNIVYNDTETREIHLLINGRNDTINKITMTGVRCISNCVEEIIDEELEDTPRFWSDIASWTNLPNRLPLEDEDIEIKSGWNMICDIVNPPKLNHLQINGKLTFMQGMDIHLQAHSIFVRAGELEIGTAAVPFTGKAKITLHGDHTESFFAFTRLVEAGNKNLVITGKASIFATPRDPASQMVRLVRTAVKGDTSIYVPIGLDWVTGDMVALAPTNMRTMDSDSATLVSYNSATGEAILDAPLTGYHWGDMKSTAEDFGGVDMRGEVMLLSRNIEITASQEINPILGEPHGCRILVSDFFEPNLVYREGSLNMDSVSVYQCSQKGTWKAAIKFESAIGGTSSVSNSAIHHGRGVGIDILSSEGVTLHNNAIYDFWEWGVRAENSQNVVITDNIVVNVKFSVWQPVVFMKWLGTPPGAYWLSKGNRGFTVTGNIAAASWHHGFHVPGKACDDDSPSFLFENNVAHSISGYGVIGANSFTSSCVEFTNFSGYKCAESTFQAGVAAPLVKVRNIVSIDSRFGITAMAGGGGRVEVHDSEVYGSITNGNVDCPDGGKCAVCLERTGIIMATTSAGSFKDVEKKSFMLPLFSGGGAMSHQAADYYNLKVINWDSDVTQCGAKQAAIKPNYQHANFHPLVNFHETKFINTVKAALFHFPSPPQGWANPTDCGTFTCTGLYNAVARFDGTQVSGTPLAVGIPSSFEVIANNIESVSSDTIPTCSLNNDWNAYLCTNEKIGVLIFDSLDGDRMDRSAQPIYIRNDRGYDNRLNAYMDECWDGFYTCQKREQRFPSMVDLDREITIEYTGTPPQEQKFKLYGKASLRGFLVTIYYPNAGAYQIYDQNRQMVMATDWDNDLETWAPVTGAGGCGEFRYEGVINRLQFWMKPGCEVYVMPRDALMLGVRLEFTMDEFFADGGVVSFADRLAGILGIEAADVKVVAVYEGSVVVEFHVTDPKDDLENLRVLDDKFRRVILTPGAGLSKDVFLGAPIIGAVSNNDPFFVANGYQNNFRPTVKEEDVESVTVYEDEEPTIQKRIQYIIRESQKSKIGFSLVILLLVVIAIICVIMVGVCCHRSCNQKKTQISAVKALPAQADTDAIEAADGKKQIDFETNGGILYPGANSARRTANRKLNNADEVVAETDRKMVTNTDRQTEGSQQKYADAAAPSENMPEEAKAENPSPYDNNDEFFMGRRRTGLQVKRATQ